MSKVIVISGSHEGDNLLLAMSSRDSFARVSIDNYSNTPNFRRNVIELNLQEQVSLCKALNENIGKWKEKLLNKEK